MNSLCRPEEYSSLREELLMLQQRAHEAWKWGIISLAAVGTAVLSTFLGIDMDPEPRIMSIIQSQTEALGTFLLLVGAGIVVVVVRLSADNLEVASRVGAYLAVFHDGITPARSEGSGYGWHVWNRIEKASERMKDKVFAPTQRFTFNGLAQTHILVFLFYSFQINLLFAATSGKFNVVLVGVALVITGLLVSKIRRVDRKLRQQTTYWTIRWTELSTLNAAQIKLRLQKAHLVASSNVATEESDDDKRLPILATAELAGVKSGSSNTG